MAFLGFCQRYKLAEKRRERTHRKSLKSAVAAKIFGAQDRTLGGNRMYIRRQLAWAVHGEPRNARGAIPSVAFFSAFVFRETRLRKEDSKRRP